MFRQFSFKNKNTHGILSVALKIYIIFQQLWPEKRAEVKDKMRSFMSGAIKNSSKYATSKSSKEEPHQRKEFCK